MKKTIYSCDQCKNEIIEMIYIINMSCNNPNLLNPHGYFNTYHLCEKCNVELNKFFGNK